MLYVALALAAANAVTVLGFLRYLAATTRAHARREDLLVNQMCNLADRPWLPAPSSETHEAPEPDLSFVSPDQWPEDDL